VPDWLIAGEAVCTLAENHPHFSVGDTTPFVIAVAQGRVLAGTAYKDGKEDREFFSYAARDLDRPIGLEFQVTKKGADMLLTEERRLLYVNTQDELKVNNHDSRLASLHGGGLHDFLFALFFSSEHCGATIAEVNRLFDDPANPAIARNTFGKLTVYKQAGKLQAIEFEQAADDIFSARMPDTKVRDVKLGQLKNGLTSCRYRCSYLPPISWDSIQPWESDCRTTYIGSDSGRELTMDLNYRVSVRTCTRNSEKVSQEIDKVLRLIPEGERVITDQTIAYVWRDGQMERAIDVQALTAAERLTMRRTASGRALVFMNILAIAALLVFIFYRRLTLH
jgi:hypothetical protein